MQALRKEAEVPYNTMGREKRLGLVLLAAVLLAQHSSASPVAEPPREQEQNGYVESRRCEDNSICTYKFVADQQFFQGGLMQNLTLSAMVKVDCYSVGTFRRYLATEYCLSVADVVVSGLPFDDKITGNEGQQEALAELFDGQFCFVQTENGRVVEVYHEEDSHPEGLNLKKTIAAAFQANFLKQEQDDEQDPQSLHAAHYRFEDTDDEDQVKMHRSVSSDDVKEYSTGTRVKDVQLQKEEDIEYRSGHLQHSSGVTSVKLSKSRRRIDGRRVSLPEGPLNDKLLSANSSYSLDLLRCQKSPSFTRGRRDAKKPMTRASLKAVVRKVSAAKAEMEDLRRAMPSIPQTLAELRTNPKNHKLGDLLEQLLVLESEYGPLLGHTPALSDVINMLSTVSDSVEPKDRATKKLLYSLLSAEGSYQAQKIIIQAIEDASSEAERVNIFAFVTFIRGAHPALLRELEQQIAKADDYLDPLLLVYGALASETTTASEQRIVSFLLSRLEQAPTSTTILVHFIHALGNTGSYYALDTIVSYLNHSIVQVQLVSISAMRKLINNALVEDMLLVLLQTTPVSIDHAAAITETLIAGYKYLDEKEIDYTPSLNLQKALVATTLQLGDIELAKIVLSFVENFNNHNTEKLANVLEQVIAAGSVEERGRRGTDWDESNSDYDIVASNDSRVADVRNYPSHQAYIYSKTLGTSKANIKIGAGVFMGVTPGCPNFKVFQKVVVEANVLSKSWDIANAELLIEKRDEFLRAKLYFKFLGNVLTDYNFESNSTYCYRPSQTLYSTSRHRLFRIKFRIFVYVASLSLYLQPHVQAHLDSRQEVCTNTTGWRISALAAIGPRISFDVEGGVRASLLSLVRGGVSVTVILEYKVEVVGEGRLCARCTSEQPIDIYDQGCVDIYQGWPNNRIELEAWYQFRRVKMCRGRIWGVKFKYPCGIEWGSRHTWDDFSKTWSLPSQPTQALHGTCHSLHNPSCPNPIIENMEPAKSTNTSTPRHLPQPP